jgi:L-fuculose-phosphate aldolase
MKKSTDIEEIVRQLVLEYLHGTQAPPSSYEAIFHSPAVTAVREEIVRTSRKLWDRQYVDGNGGNLSVRISEEYVICTPTLMSKGDVTIEDLCLCDMDGNLLYGMHPRSSELLLHLEIYKGNSAARAVVHCHPPHATAFAIAGLMPPVGIVPEQEVLVGPAPLAPYETPGTKAFAETVLPYVKDHNTVLLANHGVVCWGETVTHAEWYVEVVDQYCRTLILAAQLGVPVQRLSQKHVQDLLDIKKKMGFPDPRNADSAVLPRKPAAAPWGQITDVDALVRTITDGVVATLRTQ